MKREKQASLGNKESVSHRKRKRKKSKHKKREGREAPSGEAREDVKWKLKKSGGIF